MTRVSILTYNVLHSFGAKRLLRARSASLTLAGATWPQERLLRAAEVVKGLQPDVACLQEVDAAAHAELTRALGDEYTCVAELRNEGLPPKDGCAAFVRTSRFQVVSSRQTRIRDAIGLHCGALDADTRERGAGFAAALWRELREKLNVVLALRLRPADAPPVAAAARHGSDLCVATTHLYWDPKYPDLKLLQAYLVAKELEDFAGNCPTVLAGDLNSTPHANGIGASEDELSGVYALLTRGAVEPSHPDHPTMMRPTRGILRGVTAGDVPELRLAAPYRSAYLEALGAEGPITNASEDFHGCLDYILYRGAVSGSDGSVADGSVADGGGLRLVGVRPLPSEADLRLHFPLPSAEHPSDHLPLLAEFELQPRGC